jgi:hypothetical protein
MAGTIVSDTVQNGAGNSCTTTQTIFGSAKAWININAAATSSIRGSYNVSSITRVGTGQFNVSFTTAMSNANYVVVAMPSSDFAAARYAYVDGTNTALTTTAFTIQMVVGNGATATDATYFGAVVFGS